MTEERETLEPEIFTAPKEAPKKEEESKEIVGALSSQAIEEIDLELIEKRIDKYRKLMMLIPKLTYQQDWVDFQGKPYLASPGAERLMSRLGISMYDLKGWEEVLPDGHKVFYYTATFEFGRVKLTAMGTCSTKDQFFQVRYEYVYDEHGKVKKDEHGRPLKKKILLPVDDIDVGNVKKAAYSNLIVNGVTRVLGMRNLTWEQLEAIGFKRDKAASVKFKTKKENKE